MLKEAPPPRHDLLEHQSAICDWLESEPYGIGLGPNIVRGYRRELARTAIGLVQPHHIPVLERIDANLAELNAAVYLLEAVGTASDAMRLNEYHRDTTQALGDLQKADKNIIDAMRLHFKPLKDLLQAVTEDVEQTVAMSELVLLSNSQFKLQFVPEYRRSLYTNNRFLQDDDSIEKLAKIAMSDGAYGVHVRRQAEEMYKLHAPLGHALAYFVKVGCSGAPRDHMRDACREFCERDVADLITQKISALEIDLRSLPSAMIEASKPHHPSDDITLKDPHAKPTPEEVTAAMESAPDKILGMDVWAARVKESKARRAELSKGKP